MSCSSESVLDPNCALCGMPCTDDCDCEAIELEAAVNRSTEKMLSNVLAEIRQWVRLRARDFILAYFRKIQKRIEDEYREKLDKIARQAQRRYNTLPDPRDLEDAELELKENIDEAWKASVRRYPEVLDYFYSLVHVSLPDDKDISVTNPPFSPDDDDGDDGDDDDEINCEPRNVRHKETDQEYSERRESNHDRKQRRRRRHSKSFPEHRGDEGLRSERTRDRYGDYRRK